MKLHEDTPIPIKNNSGDVLGCQATKFSNHILINNLITTIMSKRNSTVNEAQLKARRTSLEKKSTCELVSIILRKDSTERKNNQKIQNLTLLLKESDELNEAKIKRIENFDADMEGLHQIIKVKQEQIDTLISDKNNLESQVEGWSKKYVNIKNIASLRRKVIFTCFGIIAILIIIIMCVF